MLFLLSIVISFGIMPYAVRYGAVKVICLTTGDSRQFSTDTTKTRRYSDGYEIMIKNEIALCTLHVWASDSFFFWRDRIVFLLNCACRWKESKFQRVEHERKGLSNGEEEGFFSCDKDERNRLWWKMEFKANSIGDIPFNALGIKPPDYACGAHGNAWQNTILSPLHKFFGLNAHHCCENHDVCYTDCKKNKKNCDWHFESCLYLSCKYDNLFRWWVCRKAAKWSADIVNSDLSNKAFKKAQEGCDQVQEQK